MREKVIESLRLCMAFLQRCSHRIGRPMQLPWKLRPSSWTRTSSPPQILPRNLRKSSLQADQGAVDSTPKIPSKTHQSLPYNLDKENAKDRSETVGGDGTGAPAYWTRTSSLQANQVADYPTSRSHRQTKGQGLSTDLHNKKAKHLSKTIVVGGKIAPGDWQVKCKSAHKFLAKDFEVKFQFKGSGPGEAKKKVSQEFSKVAAIEVISEKEETSVIRLKPNSIESPLKQNIALSYSTERE